MLQKAKMRFFFLYWSYYKLQPLDINIWNKVVTFVKKRANSIFFQVLSLGQYLLLEATKALH